MPAEAQHPAILECRTTEGRVIATLRLWSAQPSSLEGEEHPLIRWPVSDAQSRGEEPIQLRERGRYVYRLEPENRDDDFHLAEERGITRNPAAPDGHDEGFIEPGDQCGILPLTVLRSGDPTPAARVFVEVRSVKMNYREHYRGMLEFIATKSAGLLLDSRAPTRLRLSSEWRVNRAILEQQLEFLRHTIESEKFRSAVDQILRNPHRRLEAEREERSISRPFKAGKDLARQITRAGSRITIPTAHPMRVGCPQLTSLPVRLSVPIRVDFLDTAENRFAKMVIVEFRDFLAEVEALVGYSADEAAKPDNARLIREVTRLRGSLDTLLNRGFLPDISPPDSLPLGSPVLQRKAGYRELLHLWLQFHVGAQLAWDGGEDIWHAGSRNVATLYEYWLFFQLEAQFREKFECDAALHSILIESHSGLPRLRLQRGIELRTPVGGVWSRKTGRRLQAEFHFNRKFNLQQNHQRSGSWTRGVQPDYTISIWPAEFTKEIAEENESMVHVHFDAKYRVETASDLLGISEEEVIHSRAESPQSKPTDAKYADLLKMHAYRDAIRRTAGAYVLYPGNSGDGKKFVEFDGFHEILPGLGAFAIRPRSDGEAEGLGELSNFLDKVVEHLANRTTSRERASYHLAESYADRLPPVTYQAITFSENDTQNENRRAIPPAEHHIVVAWYDSPEQLAWTKAKGIANVRLGERRGSWHIPPEIASARHILLRTHGGVVASGLFRLRQPGYKVFTAEDLKRTGYPGRAGGEIYAVFEIEEDPNYRGFVWNGSILMNVLEAYEARMQNRPLIPLGRTSPYPRVLSLRELLHATEKEQQSPPSTE